MVYPTNGKSQKLVISHKWVISQNGQSREGYCKSYKVNPTNSWSYKWLVRQVSSTNGLSYKWPFPHMITPRNGQSRKWLVLKVFIPAYDRLSVSIVSLGATSFNREIFHPNKENILPQMPSPTDGQFHKWLVLQMVSQTLKI